MKTISEADWAVAESAIRKVMDTTLSRGEHKQLSDILVRNSAGQTYGAGFMGLCADDLSAVSAHYGVTVAIPFDGTVPQSSEGTEVVSMSIGYAP